MKSKSDAEMNCHMSKTLSVQISQRKLELSKLENIKQKLILEVYQSVASKEVKIINEKFKSDNRDSMTEKAYEEISKQEFAVNMSQIDSTIVFNNKSKIWENKELKVLIEAFNSPKKRNYMDRMVETYDIDDESYNSLRNVFMNMDLNTETVGEVNFPADISIEQLDNISGKTKHISYGGNHIRLDESPSRASSNKSRQNSKKDKESNIVSSLIRKVDQKRSK